MNRCPWGDDPLLIEYHDKEWGTQVHDERLHFEFLVLETMQAGLNWALILKKRNNFKKALNNFKPEIIVKYKQDKINELFKDSGIIRNKLKLNSIINNAKCFLEVQKEFKTFNKYIWSFVNNKVIHNKWKDSSDVPVTTKISDNLAKDLKKRGFKFLGSTTVYAHMQSIGMVNDHLTRCFRWKELQK